MLMECGQGLENLPRAANTLQIEKTHTLTQCLDCQCTPHTLSLNTHTHTHMNILPLSHTLMRLPRD